MVKLGALLLVSLFFAALAQLYDVGKQRADAKERFFIVLLTAVLVLYCGLRTWFNDTVTYLQMYEQTPPVSKFFLQEDLRFSKGVGFLYVLSWMKTLGFSAQDYLMFFAAVTVIPYVWFVRRYCREHFIFGAFLMFATGMYAFTFAAIKQCVATAICLLAISRAEKRRWISFILIVLFACLFHPYAVIYLIVPFLQFRPWSGKTIFTIFLMLIMVSVFPNILGFLVDITEEIGADYSVEELGREGVNIFRVLVVFSPVLLSFIYQRRLFRDSSRMEDLMVNLAMMNAFIMFIGLFGTANYFARLANYFLPAQVVVIPWMIGKLGKNDRKLISILCVFGYLGFFYYENAILKSMDLSMAHMSLWTYLLEHF